VSIISPVCLIFAGLCLVVAVSSLLSTSEDSEDNAFAFLMLTALFLIAAGVWR
jgi:hypothetical membrane protein